MLDKSLTQEILRFRAALDRKPETPFRVLKNFPRGSCKLCSMLLTKYLLESDLINKENVLLCANGENQNKISHAWLIIDGIVVDITSDQFNEVDQIVIIAEKYEFHKKFTGTNTFKFNSYMKINNKRYEQKFLKTYEILTSKMA
ncbi:MAG TPA: hypothetical protein QF468_12215 [Nitrospinota bacterium]|jgi:hypothetical protein|nr:hypothetical protein [Nitrospinota bacterium]|tara:strand:- start:1429 stop:1860 length:432 start_codon:yes stop_codon:yes gene_type:complete